MSKYRSDLNLIKAMCISMSCILAAIYINGRNFNDSQVSTIREVVAEELEKTRVTPPPTVPEIARMALQFSHPLDIDGDGKVDCSSTAISARALLTATHCLPEGLGPLAVSGVVMEPVDREDDGADHTILLFSDPVFVIWAEVSLDALQPGDRVHMLGNPATLTHVFRSGVVSGSRPFNAWQALVLDLNAHPGDSGSGLLDALGRVRGVVSFVDSSTSGPSYMKLTGILPFEFTNNQWEKIHE